MSAAIYSIDGKRLDQAPPIRDVQGRRRRAIIHLGTSLRATGYHFAPVSCATLRRINARPENACAFDVAAIFGWNRLFRSALPGPLLLDLMHDAQVIDTCHTLLRSSVRAVSFNGQLFLHSTSQDEREASVGFGPNEFRFVRALRTVLPRYSRNIGRSASLCCGAGAGAITIAKFHPRAEIFATDSNATALAFSDINARIAGVANVNLVTAGELDDAAGTLDLIVANPSWVCDDQPRSVDLVIHALERLAKDGTLMLHAGVGIARGTDLFRNAIEPRLRACGFSWNYEQLDPDISGEALDAPNHARLDRIAAVWLCATKRK